MPVEADGDGGGPGDDAPEEDAEHDDVPQEDGDAPQRVDLGGNSLGVFRPEKWPQYRPGKPAQSAV